MFFFFLNFRKQLKAIHSENGWTKINGRHLIGHESLSLNFIIIIIIILNVYEFGVFWIWNQKRKSSTRCNLCKIQYSIEIVGCSVRVHVRVYKFSALLTRSTLTSHTTFINSGYYFIQHAFKLQCDSILDLFISSLTSLDSLKCSTYLYTVYSTHVEL